MFPVFVKLKISNTYITSINIKDCGDFLKKVKHLGPIPDGAILVTADVVGLYPSIPHKAGLEALRRRLNKRETFEIPTEDIVQMTEFVLKNNFFESVGEETKIRYSNWN